MFSKLSTLLIVSLVPCFSWAAFTGDYATPDGKTTMKIQADGQTFTVIVHKDTDDDTCNVEFDLFPADDNPNKLFANVRGCYVTVLTNNEWASITGNANCANMCEYGSLDTQGLQHR